MKTYMEFVHALLLSFFCIRELWQFCRETLQFRFQCSGGVESPEHFGSQPWHQLLQVGVEDARVQPIKQQVLLDFVLHEEAQILEHLLVHFNHVFIPHGVFAQEVKLNHTFLVRIQVNNQKKGEQKHLGAQMSMQSDVLNTKRTTPNLERERVKGASKGK